MLEKVRVFGKQIDPAQYRQGYGWRGLFLNFLNWFRVRLERRIALMIFFLEARKQGCSKEQAKHLVEDVQQNDQTRHWLFEDDRFQTFKRALPRQQGRVTYDGLKERSVHRYGQGRKNHAPDTIEEGALAGTLARAERSMRSNRYFRGRQHIIQARSEDAIVAVLPENSERFREQKLAHRMKELTQ